MLLFTEGEKKILMNKLIIFYLDMTCLLFIMNLTFLRV